MAQELFTKMMRTKVFKLADQYGYADDSQLARAMGVSQSLVNRVRHQKRGINQTFIAGARRAFPDKTLDELFVVDNEPEQAIA